ncbi:Serine/threonine-protein kinase PINK1, mitochondrial [Liparis tanakae]|uniref:Serine/threonine-protein kinase PINK1, mitochondrial n=1 Tax=Liparis tanakae TaxID=230148 RepID=A0A4Z2E357_9TELE|nr:Serine/threonine-protein kinase PINK1, mitochondrial [Liparis tanakae]
MFLQNISPHLQAVFRKKRFQSPFKPFSSGYKLEDYTIGNQIGKGSNAAVYEAAARFAPQESHGKRSKIQPGGEEEQEETTPSLTCCSLHTFPMAVKMMWNFGVSIFTMFYNFHYITRVRTVMENLEKSWNFKMVISRPGKVMEKT